MKNGSDQRFNMTIPIPVHEQDRNGPQQWLTSQYQKKIDLRYQLPHIPDVVSGEVWIATAYGQDVVHQMNVELRFGQHRDGLNRGMILSLRERYCDDDKYNVARASAANGTGTLHGYLGVSKSFIFRPYPFQLDRLKRMMECVSDIDELQAMIGAHVRLCLRLLQE